MSAKKPLLQGVWVFLGKGFSGSEPEPDAKGLEILEPSVLVCLKACGFPGCRPQCTGLSDKTYCSWQDPLFQTKALMLRPPPLPMSIAYVRI